MIFGKEQASHFALFNVPRYILYQHQIPLHRFLRLFAEAAKHGTYEPRQWLYQQADREQQSRGQKGRSA